MLKKEIDDLKDEVPALKQLDEIKDNIDNDIKNHSFRTADKFRTIDKLVAAGKTSYEDMAKAGISTYLYSKWKKDRKGATAPREAPSKTVAEAVAELKTAGKSPTYANLRTFGFTNAVIKEYKSSAK